MTNVVRSSSRSDRAAERVGLDGLAKPFRRGVFNRVGLVAEQLDALLADRLQAADRQKADTRLTFDNERRAKRRAAI